MAKTKKPKLPMRTTEYVILEGDGSIVYPTPPSRVTADRRLRRYRRHFPYMQTEPARVIRATTTFSEVVK